MYATQQHLSTAVVWRVSQLFGVGALVGIVVYVAPLLERVRLEFFKQQLATETVLQTRVQAAALTAEFGKRAHDLERVDALLLQRDNFADLITMLEGQALRYEVSMRVPRITEAADEKQAEEKLHGGRALEDVHVQVVASGSAEDLLRFLYAVDHLPYLLTVPTWELTVGSVPGDNFERIVSDDESKSKAPRAVDSEVKSRSRLLFDVVVATDAETGTDSVSDEL